MDWYYAKDGAQQGPVSVDELRQRLASGQLARTDLVWREGMADWTAAGSVAELAQAGGPVAPQAAPGGVAPRPVAGGVAQPAAGVVAGQPAAGRQQGLALASMICGIVALLGVCVYLGVPVGLAAVVLGHLAKSKIRKQPQVYSGKGMAIAGLITGYLAVVLGAAILAFVLWIATADPSKMEFLPAEMREQIEHERQLRQQQGTEQDLQPGESN